MLGATSSPPRSARPPASSADRAHSDNALALIVHPVVGGSAPRRPARRGGAELRGVLGFEPGGTPLPRRRRGALAARRHRRPADDGDAHAELGRWAATALGDRPLDSEWLPETAQLAQLAAEVGKGPPRRCSSSCRRTPTGSASRVSGRRSPAQSAGTSRRWPARSAPRGGRPAAVGGRRRPPPGRPGRRSASDGAGGCCAVAPPTDRAASLARSETRSAHSEPVHEGATWAITFRGVTQRVATARACVTSRTPGPP